MNTVSSFKSYIKRSKPKSCFGHSPHYETADESPDGEERPDPAGLLVVKGFIEVAGLRVLDAGLPGDPGEGGGGPAKAAAHAEAAEWNWNQKGG